MTSQSATDSNGWVIVIGDAEPLLFASREAAERYMEPIDVRDGVYRAFDHCGRPMVIEVRSGLRRKRWLVGDYVEPERTYLAAPDLAANFAGEVTPLIADYLHRVFDLEVESRELQDLLRMFEEHVGFTR